MSCTSTTSCENAVRNSVVAISSAAAISRGQIVSMARRVIVHSVEHDPENPAPHSMRGGYRFPPARSPGVFVRLARCFGGRREGGRDHDPSIWRGGGGGGGGSA